MLDNDEQFNKWVDQWDKAQKLWTGDKDLKQVDSINNFFGLQKEEPQEDFSPNEDWKDIYDRSGDIRQEVLLNEEQEGWKKFLAPPGKETKFFQHPQHHSSIGMDQSKSPYEPTRVAPNFTDGDELRELDKLKRKLHKLEDSLLRSEIKSGKSNVKPQSYKTQLDKLRKQIDELSDKLTPEPSEDVY